MADLETLKGLMLRAQAAKEADRALDEAIMAAFYVRDRRYIGAHDYYTDERLDDDVWVDPRTDKFVTNQAFWFTSEAGAVERLIGFPPPPAAGKSARRPLIRRGRSPPAARGRRSSHGRRMTPAGASARATALRQTCRLP